jgi:hypothetical protein
MTGGKSSHTTAGAPNRDEWKALYTLYDRGGLLPYHSWCYKPGWMNLKKIGDGGGQCVPWCWNWCWRVGDCPCRPNRKNLVKEYVRNMERSIMIHNTRREAHIWARISKTWEHVLHSTGLPAAHLYWIPSSSAGEHNTRRELTLERFLRLCRVGREESNWWWISLRDLSKGTRSLYFFFQVEWNHNRSTSQVSESKLWTHTLSYEDLGV